MKDALDEIDLTAFVPMLDEMGLSDEEALECLQTIAQMMVSIIRLRFGLDPVSLVLNERVVDNLQKLSEHAEAKGGSMVQLTFGDKLMEEFNE